MLRKIVFKIKKFIAIVLARLRRSHHSNKKAFLDMMMVIDNVV
jgi:hypothetical protein